MKTVILCGGSGTRLWPVSRKTTPKQFAKIFGGKSLFEMTLERNANSSDSFLIVVNQAQLPACKEQVGSLKSKFLAEFVGRNTAPAIALAAFASGPNDILLVLPSDHLIKDQSRYESCVSQAKSLAEAGHLVTFGIKAAYPETGYGYIEADGNEVKSFKEKPNLDLAKEYVESGRYFWNSGMFCFKASVFLEELKKHSPEIHKACELAQASLDIHSDTVNLTKEIMSSIPADSIDYAVMEKSDNVKVVASDFYWSDLGSFDSLYDELDKDEQGNTESSDFYQIDSKNNLILGNKRVIATFGVEDLVIVDTGDALLVGKRGETQKVKELMQKVTADKPELAD